jgi:hypothetical protein
MGWLLGGEIRGRIRGKVPTTFLTGRHILAPGGFRIFASREAPYPARQGVNPEYPMKRKLTLIACLATAAVMAPASASVASDRDHRHEPEATELAGGLVSPLHLAVGTNKSVLVTQDFAGKLSRVNRDKTVTNIYQAAAGFGVAGVETRGATTFFLETAGAGSPNPAELKGFLKAINPRGDVRQIADLAEHERKNNPDAGQEYGFGRDASTKCLDQAAAIADAPPARYNGALDSNAYATAVQGNTAYVADAGANAVLKVNIHSGAVSTVAVLPPRPSVLTAEAAAALKAPDCANFKYAFEPVPTDVEIGPDGWLYVTSLPGGPEVPGLGARGAVFKINPWTGHTRLWVDGILSPTGLAVANTGDVYVASLFGNEILKFSAWKGHRSVFLPVPAPADVEVHGRTLYATVDAFNPTAPPPPPAEGRVIKADIR